MPSSTTSIPPADRVVLTVNGKAEAVIMDAGEYERTMQAMNLLRLLIPAEEDVKEGRVREATAF